MANLVLTAAATVIGYTIGGPAGAQIGYTVGPAVGELYFPAGDTVHAQPTNEPDENEEANHVSA